MWEDFGEAPRNFPELASRAARVATSARRRRTKMLSDKSRPIIPGMLPVASGLSEADKEASRSLVLGHPSLLEQMDENLSARRSPRNITIENQVREFRHELQCRDCASSGRHHRSGVRRTFRG